MVIFQAWKHKLSAAVGLLVLLVILLWPAIPLHSLDIWLKTLFSYWPTNILYPIFAIIIATQAALFIYDKKVAKCCRVPQTKTSAASSFAGVLLGACPACIPVLGFFLPLSATIAIGYYSWVILIIAIIITLYSIKRSGGFQRVVQPKGQ
ncbi:hypothetical protein CYG49_01470 [Candidatus Saccharibacteria bacterium]|nr:MAG: hypothetical protein CYG49_01470 [Candidatus Saccharibacteria bacterium]